MDEVLPLSPFFNKAIERYSKKHGIPLQTASTLLVEELALFMQRPNIRREFSGLWNKEFEAVAKEKDGAKQRKQRFVAKQSEDKKAEYDEELFDINYKVLKKADITSGFADVYRNNTGWRARVKEGDQWKFLATHKYAEKAAWDRYQWYETRDPSQNLPADVAAYFKFWLDLNPDQGYAGAIAHAVEQTGIEGKDYSYLLIDSIKPLIDSDKIKAARASAMEERKQQEIENARAEGERILAERATRKPGTEND